MTTQAASDGRGSLRLAIAMATGPLVALGLARFAYALLLPTMREDLGWSYSAAGTLNTSNAAGYLIGAIIGARLAAYAGAGRVFVLGIAGTAVLLLATAATSWFPLLVAIRLLAGVTSALSFVIGGGIVAEASHRASKARAAMMLGLYFGGAGLGIVLSGLLVPFVLEASGGSWRLGWVTLAGLAGGALVVGVLATRRTTDPAPPEPGSARWDRRAIGPIVAAYTCFGLGYIAYLTFVIALLRERGLGDVQVAVFWALVGLAAFAAGFFWGAPLGRLQGGRGMAVVMSVLALGTVLPVLSDSMATTYVSGLLVGGSMLSVVTAMTVGVRQALPRPNWTAGIAYATVGFGLGQTVGPVLTGWVSDRFESLTSGFAVSAAVLALGAALALLQQSDRAEATPPR